MRNTKRHPDFFFVKRVIGSCESQFQIETAYKIISAYSLKHKTIEDISYLKEVIRKKKQELHDKDIIYE